MNHFRRSMKYVIAVMILASFVLSGCSSEFGLDNAKWDSVDDIILDGPSSQKEVDLDHEMVAVSVLDRFFDLYSKMDMQGLNAMNPAEDRNDLNIDRYNEHFEKTLVEWDKIAGNYFLYFARLESPYTYIRSMDYLKLDKNDINPFVYKYYGNGSSVNFKYKIIDIYEPYELNSISYMSGLRKVDEKPQERIDQIFQEKNISEWYGVSASVEWYINGTRYGFSEEILSDLKALNPYWESTCRKKIEDLDNRVYNFIIYKYKGEWCIYGPRFIDTSYSRSLIFE